MGKTKSPTNASGFTLMEVMVAMTLITLVLAGGIAALIQGDRIVEDARDVTRVSQVIQSEIEALRTKTWEDLDALTYPSDSTRKFYPYYKVIPLTGAFAAKYGDRYTLWRGVYYLDTNGDGSPGEDDQIAVLVWVGWKPQKGAFYKWQRYYARFTRDGLNDYYYRAFPSD